METVSEPFDPPLGHLSEYSLEIDNYNKKHDSQRKTVVSVPHTPFPKLLVVKTEGFQGIYNICASLTHNIGKVSAKNLTQIQDDYILRVEKDSQSCMLVKNDYYYF